MKVVRIIGATKPTYWYAKHIGHEFAIDDREFEGGFKLYTGGLFPYDPRFINKNDCVELIPDNLFEL